MKKIIITSLGILTVFLVACLKDKRVNLDEDQTPAVVEFGNPAAPASPSGSSYVLYKLAYNVTASIDVSLKINYTGPSVAPADIPVEIGVTDSKPIDQYNEEQETEYEQLGSNLYTFPSSTVTIPKGQKSVTFTFQIKTGQFDFTKEYALGLQIKSASSVPVSSNFGTILLNLSAKNKYDGVYTVTATAPLVDVVVATISGYYPLENVELHTVGASSVTLYDGQYFAYGYYHPIRSGSSTSAYGNFSPVFNIDDQGNVTSVTNYYGQGTNTSGRAGRINPDGVNKFTVSEDGKTKTLEVSYVMVENGVDRTSFHEKFVFTGER